MASQKNIKTEQIEGVLIVGGGYAGLHAAAAVLHEGVSVTVIDSTGQHDHITRLAAVAGGTGTINDASSPLESFVKHVVIGKVTNVQDGLVALEDGRSFQAQAVIVAAGSASSRPPLPGIEFAYPLRSASDAVLLRSLIVDAPSLVIIGGGATGVQLAGAVASAHPAVEVQVLEASSRLLGGLPPELGAGAQRILEGRQVQVFLGCKVEKITATGAVVDSKLHQGLVVWAGGSEAPGALLGLPTAANGQISLDKTLLVEGFMHTFAAGDTAFHSGADDKPLPMSAQVAVRAGTAAGQNAVRLIKGEPLKAAELRQLGWVLDLGGRRGLFQLGPINLSQGGVDLIPPVLHEIIDLMGLFEMGGKEALRFASSSARSLIPFRLPE